MIASCTHGIGIYYAIFITSSTGGKAVKGLRVNNIQCTDNLCQLVSLDIYRKHSCIAFGLVKFLHLSKTISIEAEI